MSSDQDDTPGTGAPGDVTHVATARLPTRHGEFTAHIYRNRTDQTEHMVLVRGEVRGQEGVLVRLHSECLTGDVFGSLRCDCGEQLDRALAMMTEEGRGVLVYLRGHEGRGIGLSAKLRAYALQDRGYDTVQANEALGLAVDARSYDAGVTILRDLGVESLRLISNNPLKFAELESLGLRIDARIPLRIAPNPENREYLRTKQQRLGHSLALDDPEQA
ncbi:GTP cyclohydrolase II [Alkalilimnicola sp. S0819]|uniref:GTP cyclohydrolase II n=1 Tax=Alkalilimnicola sp. S0819 TaxID=2613922 RepID=UPI001261B921|nr:GTP cyclohydrolase II [Alkalilimnicola sp. S0819]KAB7627370.1 GTP cyclohydrolase II [Alkalilimnicola sp. S0819]MPQ16088.1 GTP cyclohydrolase II [Alkalilimnicola sp. S0819]